MSRPTGVDKDAPTLEEIDEALHHIWQALLFANTTERTQLTQYADHLLDARLKAN